jgi:hypothetical protein
MKLSHSWEPSSCANTQELLNILWNPRVHYRLHKSPSLVSVLCQIDPVLTSLSHLSKIHFNIIHHLRLCLGLPGNLFFLASPPISYIYYFSPHLYYMTFPSHLPWFDHSNYNWRRLQVMKLINTSFLPPPVTIPCSVQIFSSAPCSQTHSVHVHPILSETKFILIQDHRQDYGFFRP